MNLPKWALAAGALAGGAMALASVLWTSDPRIEPGSDAAALVNGYAIPVEDVEIALEAMARDSRNPLPDDAAEHALNRLIDEELLFQQAMALDLPRNASTVRRTIVMTMIDFAQAGADSEPGEAQLRDLFDANLDFFAAQDRYRVRWMSAATPGGEQTRPAAHPPNRMLTTSELRLYLGDALTAAIRDLGGEGRIGPIECNGRYHFLSVVEFSPAAEPDFEANRARVEALWEQRAAEAALEAYIADLRAQADIRIQPFAGE
jgi:hypothetical protein